MDVDFVKPKGVWDSQPIGFSQVVRVRQPGAIVWVAGQGPHDLEGNRPSDFEGQARSAFRNLQTALTAAGATFDDVVKMNVFTRNDECNRSHCGREQIFLGTVDLILADRSSIIFELEYDVSRPEVGGEGNPKFVARDEPADEVKSVKAVLIRKLTA